MLKSKFAKLNELGSLMVEAMAMLALISMVTPILYRKAAERTTELQDINAAGQMRSLIKAVDDYVSDNYNTIVAGNAVNNSVNNSVNYSDLVSGGKKTIDIKHFRDYLPYGFLDSSGNVQDTKTFSKDYKVVFKYTDAGGRKAVTAFVVAELFLQAVRCCRHAYIIAHVRYIVKPKTGNICEKFLNRCVKLLCFHIVLNFHCCSFIAFFKPNSGIAIPAAV